VPNAYPPDGYDERARPLFLKWAELTYAAAGLEVPPWAVVAHPADRRAAPAAAAEPTATEALDLFRQFASATATALSNIENRLVDVEHRVAASPSDARVPLAS
jgi:hypothetical protein